MKTYPKFLTLLTAGILLVNCTEAKDTTNEKAQATFASEETKSVEPVSEEKLNEEVRATVENTSEVINAPADEPIPEEVAKVTKESTPEPTHATSTETTTAKQDVKPESIEAESAIEVVKEVEGISHAAFDALLKKYVSSSGKVNYKGFKSEFSKLKSYTAKLTATPPASSWSRNEKLAYWINVYNAFTIQLILENYPISSITKIDNGKPWDRKFIKIGSKTYSLNQVENEIIRPTFKEPRIHFAVNCAAVSCPKILNAAFVADKLESQLTKQTKYFVNNTSKNKLSQNSIQVSKIFEWYAVDFKSAGGVAAFVKKYANSSVSSSAKVSYLEYKWDLNE